MIDLVELAATARSVIDANKYMVLGTADADGTPWTTPVYFTPQDYAAFYWVSSPEARHSRNIETRSTVSIVVFDSQVPIGGAQAVYLSAVAVRVPEAEVDAGAEVYRSRQPEVSAFGPEQMRGSAPFRLYRATVTQASVLLPGRHPDNPRGADDRVVVDLRSGPST